MRRERRNPTPFLVNVNRAQGASDCATDYDIGPCVRATVWRNTEGEIHWMSIRMWEQDTTHARVSDAIVTGELRRGVMRWRATTTALGVTGYRLTAAHDEAVDRYGPLINWLFAFDQALPRTRIASVDYDASADPPPLWVFDGA